MRNSSCRPEARARLSLSGRVRLGTHRLECKLHSAMSGTSRWRLVRKAHCPHPTPVSQIHGVSSEGTRKSSVDDHSVVFRAAQARLNQTSLPAPFTGTWPVCDLVRERLNRGRRCSRCVSCSLLIRMYLCTCPYPSAHAEPCSSACSCDPARISLACVPSVDITSRH
ncbi:uncharacterized protein M421DRAFT_124472 [Didymella exigua CBS 183.55]|uniref:Uncharacterized protein n=1 Tax=Didymella exigua CBS 183.55 TaxID=1150837 RepID=A0A6A5RWC5_9PLEO|nr:uncharacterized protein M421DRAFT_124472 [Didymella exigua CBS 183.55]KAF1929587.1 hypothetical protein M421DRAFT_124472 [Didymella exigua CBS 183.55]